MSTYGAPEERPRVRARPKSIAPDSDITVNAVLMPLVSGHARVRKSADLSTRLMKG